MPVRAAVIRPSQRNRMLCPGHPLRIPKGFSSSSSSSRECLLRWAQASPKMGQAHKTLRFHPGLEAHYATGNAGGPVRWPVRLFVGRGLGSRKALWSTPNSTEVTTDRDRNEQNLNGFRPRRPCGIFSPHENVLIAVQSVDSPLTGTTQ